MKELLLVDTSILLNVLNVPGRNQDRSEVQADFERFIAESKSMFINIPVLVETGNFISNLKGHDRRSYSEKFVKMIDETENGSAPWRFSRLLTEEQLKAEIKNYVNQSTQGLSFADFLILVELNLLKRKFENCSVNLWTLDKELRSFSLRP